MRLYSVFNLYFGFTIVYSSELSSLLPSYIKPCLKVEKHFDKCCLDHAREALPYVLKGDMNFSIPSFLPFQMNLFGFTSKGGLEIVCTDVNVHGFETLKIHSLRFDLVANKYFIEMHMQFARINSKYEIYGKEMILPIDGQGNATVSFGGLNITVDGKYHLKSKNNIEYMEFDENPLAKASIKKAHFRFENLFSGQKKLEDDMNKALNDDWKRVIEEVNPSLRDEILYVCLAMINNALDGVPYNVIFPEK